MRTSLVRVYFQTMEIQAVYLLAAGDIWIEADKL